jgi:3-deoxy-manno-octulosonate cytidylyltransferase (CMP-KDO synthetase)
MTMSDKYNIVIPARYDSSRLPGKPLADINGKPMIQHVYERACESRAAEVVIATDNTWVGEIAEAFGASVCMTRTDHESGTDRLCEVLDTLDWDDATVVVNLQGDEPLMPPAIIDQVANNLLQHKAADCATLYTDLSATEAKDPNIVKLVTDSEGYALYFSRAVIPFVRDPDATQAPVYKRHLGLYAYTGRLLRLFRLLPPCELEQTEKLEQLRLLWNGRRIHAALALTLPGHGVDTADDLERVRSLLASGFQPGA